MKKDRLFGYMGIDSKYEKDLIYYKPILDAVRSPLAEKMPARDRVKTQRAKTFMISSILIEYDRILNELSELMEYIKEEDSNFDYDQVDKLIEAVDIEGLVELESKNDSYEENRLYDKYSLLKSIYINIEKKKNQILENFSVKFKETENYEDLIDQEMKSIEEWEVLCSKAEEVRKNIRGSSTDPDGDMYLMGDSVDYSSEMIVEMDMLIQEKEKLHRNISDMGYIHKVFIKDIDMVMSGLRMIILNPKLLIPESRTSTFEYEIEELLNKKEVLTLLEIDYFDKANSYYLKKKSMDEIIVLRSYIYGEQARFFHTLNENVLGPIEDTIVTAKISTEGATESLVDLLSKQYVSLTDKYENTISDMYNDYRKEASKMFNIVYAMKEKEITRIYYILINRAL